MAEETTKESKAAGGRKSIDKTLPQWEATLIDLGLHALSGLLSGFTLAAGGYAFQSLMRGSQTHSRDSNVVPLHRLG
jgi:hypothetical protein